MKKLSNKQMSQVQGGVTRAEYCATAKMIINHNEISADRIALVDAICNSL